MSEYNCPILYGLGNGLVRPIRKGFPIAINIHENECNPFHGTVAWLQFLPGICSCSFLLQNEAMFRNYVSLFCEIPLQKPVSDSTGWAWWMGAYLYPALTHSRFEPLPSHSPLPPPFLLALKPLPCLFSLPFPSPTQNPFSPPSPLPLLSVYTRIQREQYIII